MMYFRFIAHFSREAGIWLWALFKFCHYFLSSALLSSGMYYSFSAKSPSMFNLFLLLAGFPVIVHLNIFLRRPSCLRTCPSQLCFWCLMASFTLCSTSIFVTVFFQLARSILQILHISEASSLFLSANNNVWVSTAYEMMLHMVLHIWFFRTTPK